MHSSCSWAETSGDLHWTAPGQEQNALELWPRILARMDPIAPAGGGFECIKKDPGTIVLRGPDPLDSNREIWIKRYLRPYRILNPRRWFGAPGPAHAEADRIVRAAAAGVPTSTVIACGLKRSRNSIESVMVCRSPLHTRRLGAVLLDMDPRSEPHRERAVRLLRKVFASLLNLHDGAGLIHNDVNMGNVLVHGAEDDLLFIDFHRCRRKLPFFDITQRTRDLTKLHHFLEDYFDREEWFQIMQTYTRGDARLETAIRGVWENVKQIRRDGKVQRVVRTCMHNRMYHVWEASLYPIRLRRDSGVMEVQCRLLHDRDFSGDWLAGAIAGITFEERDMEISIPHPDRGERMDLRIHAYEEPKRFEGFWSEPPGSRAWREAVERACRGLTEWAPLAFLRIEGKGALRSYRIDCPARVWPKRRPLYALSWMFSLERMSEQAYTDILDRR